MSQNTHKVFHTSVKYFKILNISHLTESKLYNVPVAKVGNQCKGNIDYILQFKIG